MRRRGARGRRPARRGENLPNYLSAEDGLRSWLLTRDHERIGLLYMASVTAFLLLGGLYALSIRLELLTPRGDLFQAQTYNKLFTQHGIIMVFFFLIPSIPAAPDKKEESVKR